MTFTLGDIVHLVGLIVIGGGLFIRIGALGKTISQLEKALEKIDPHVSTVPLLVQRVTQLEAELASVRSDRHNLANTVQWIVGRLEDIAPREPSRPDLSIERDPRRR